MAEITGQTKLDPFHKTVLAAIGEASSASLEDLAKLIKTTDIPSNHLDEVVAAWRSRMQKKEWHPDSFGVVENLLARKRTCAAEESEIRKVQVAMVHRTAYMGGMDHGSDDSEIEGIASPS